MAIKSVLDLKSGVIYPVCMLAADNTPAGLVLSQICYFFEKQKNGKRPLDAMPYAKKWVNILKILERERQNLAADPDNARKKLFLMSDELRDELVQEAQARLAKNPKGRGCVEFVALPPDRIQDRTKLYSSTIAKALTRLREAGLIYQVRGNNRQLKQRNATIVRPRWPAIFAAAEGVS